MVADRHTGTDRLLARDVTGSATIAERERSVMALKGVLIRQ